MLRQFSLFFPTGRNDAFIKDMSAIDLHFLPRFFFSYNFFPASPLFSYSILPYFLILSFCFQNAACAPRYLNQKCPSSDHLWVILRPWGTAPRGTPRPRGSCMGTVGATPTPDPIVPTFQITWKVRKNGKTLKPCVTLSISGMLTGLICLL